jgi:hypothetical protein
MHVTTNKNHVATLNDPFVYTLTMHMGRHSKNFAQVSFSAKFVFRLPGNQTNVYSAFLSLLLPRLCHCMPAVSFSHSLLESLSSLQTFHCVCWWFCLDMGMKHEVFARSAISLVTVSAKQSFVTALSINIGNCRQCRSLFCRSNFRVLSVAMWMMTPFLS